MSVFRTVYPRDVLTVTTPDGPITIVFGGTNVPDQHDHLILAAAEAYRVPIVQGGAVVVPGHGTLEQRVGDVESALRAAVVPLAEQPPRATSGAVVRSGELVPFATGTGSTTPVTVTLEPGGTGSRAGIRLDSGTRPLVLAGSGADVVPPVTLTDPGSVLIVEGITGGGGWRIITAYIPPRAPRWTEILERPTIPNRYDQLSGSVPALAIPSSIARQDAVDGKAPLSHSHAQYAPTAHTHPRVLGPYSPASYVSLAAGASGRTAGSVVVPDPGFDWSPLAFGQMECRAQAAGTRAAVGIYRGDTAGSSMVAHGSMMDTSVWTQVLANPRFGTSNPVIAAGASTTERTFLLVLIADFGTGSLDSTTFYIQMNIWILPA